MNGRRYSDASPPASGTQSESMSTIWRTASRKTSSGSSGMAMRSAELFRRFAFCSGRNAVMLPSAWR